MPDGAVARSGTPFGQIKEFKMDTEQEELNAPEPLPFPSQGKRKCGPNPKEKEFLRDKRIAFRVTESDYKKLEQQALSLNCSVSAYMYKRIVEEKVTFTIKRSLDSNIFSELNRIGKNLNQIAYRLNTKGNSENITPELEAIFDIKEEISRFLTFEK